MKILNLIAYSKSGFEQNIGDSFTSIALKKYLKRNQDRWTVGYFNLKKINLNNYDLVILGGGGLYHPDHLKTLAKNTNIFSTSTLLAIIGVGLNLDGRQQFKPIDNQRLTSLIQKSFINTVRDNWSSDYLKSLGLKTQVTGCPSLFLPELYKLKSKKTYDLGLNFCLHHAGLYQKKAQQTLRFIDQVIKKLEGEKIVICHSKLEKRFYQKIFPCFKVFYSSKPKQVFSVYQSCQMVIGMRGHSQLFSLAVNTPSIALPLNEKVAQPVKMTTANYQPLIISLDSSLSSVKNSISYLKKNQAKLKQQQRRLKKKLNRNFLLSIKPIHEHCCFS